MAVIVWLRINAGDIVETAKDKLADVHADMDASTVTDRVNAGTDWAAVAKSAGSAVAEGAGSLLRLLNPEALLLMVGDWFLSGALEMLGTEAGKPAADALGKLGDAWLDVMVRVIAPLIPLLSRAIRAVVPVLSTVIYFWVVVAQKLEPVWGLVATVLGLAADLLSRLFYTITAIALSVRTVLTTIDTALGTIAATIDGFVGGLVDGFTNLLRYIIDFVLGPIHGYLDDLSSLWDEWIGQHLTDLSQYPRNAEGYFWNGQLYRWGEGPFPQERPAAGGQVVEHPASDAELMAAIGAYSRLNGGLARALWGPA